MKYRVSGWQNSQEVGKLAKKKLPFFDGTKFEVSPRVTLFTHEGKAAVEDAIQFLKKQKPLGEVESRNIGGLRLSAEDHVADAGVTGSTEHGGSDGSRPPDRAKRYGKWHKHVGETLWYGQLNTGLSIVLDLIIDDGVPDRGHRTIIYTPSYKVVGARIGDHINFGSMCCILFADDFTLDESLMRARCRAGPRKVDPALIPKPKDQPNWGTCVRCKKTITGGAVMTTDKGKWHKECFACHECKTSLEGLRFNVHDDREYCKQCFEAKHAPRCAKCKKPLADRWKIVKGLNYHPQCLK
eukprot:GEMP01059277.1.p1 GENE.GEMP01059277.1~~GEMP01059277.1.p1  ORF type:complete len:297 (+),score=55.22 GEMP01059277.1:76-966(+)